MGENNYAYASEYEPLDNIVINSATVYFSDGSQQQVNLGEIIFYYEKGLDEAIKYISIIS